MRCSQPRIAPNDNKAGTAEAAAVAVDVPVDNERGKKLIAYYLHGTYRCPTCLSIESLSREAVETEFADMVMEGTVAFVSVNYDERENAHFADDCQLTAPSLVLSLRKSGAEVAWKNLSKVWECVHNPPELREYVSDELQEMLMEMH